MNTRLKTNDMMRIMTITTFTEGGR